MKKTVTQWIWLDCLKMDLWLPADSQKAVDPVCWLCGGETNCYGWPLKKIIGSAFTDYNVAQAPYSKAICGSCAALMKKETWELACNKHGHDPYFPVKDGKKPFMANWMFSSHVFSVNGWQRPGRSESRDILVSPPDPPFVVTLAEAGKKHVLFRSRVNQTKNKFSVQIDENEVFIDHQAFLSCLDWFERGYNAGFSKESLLTGRYNHKSILNAGIENWQNIESWMMHYRKNYPELMHVCHFCAQRQAK